MIKEFVGIIIIIFIVWSGASIFLQNAPEPAEPPVMDFVCLGYNMDGYRCENIGRANKMDDFSRWSYYCPEHSGYWAAESNEPITEPNDSFDSLLVSFAELDTVMSEYSTAVNELFDKVSGMYDRAATEPNLGLYWEPNDSDINLTITTDYAINEVTYLEITLPDVNNIKEAAQEMRELLDATVMALQVFDPKPLHTCCVADIRATLGDETHTKSFEEFFEWMGFRNEEPKEFCITSFNFNNIDNPVNGVDFLRPDDPNALMTMREFIFRAITYEPNEPVTGISNKRNTK